ncbi:MAG: ABC transporter ATP-binding protein [Gemmobacter sp.]
MTVTVRGAVKGFAGRAAVDGIDLAIAAGEFVAVVGASGCGKSTLLRLIAGLETLDAGSIALGARIVSGPGIHVPPEARGVGVVFQSYALWPHMTVRDNVAFPAQSAGTARAAARAEADRHLATVGLALLADRRPAALSGGQRQRVALARCLAQGARIILMDEPLANLDPHLRAAMEEELAAFHARAGASTLYITHDQREAFAIADRVAVMAAGRILQCDTPETVYARPGSEAVARFIGRGAILDATVAGGAAHLGPATLPATSTPPGPVRILIRPDDVVIAPDAPLAATVQTALYRGGHWEATATVPGLAEPLAVSSRTRLRPGETLRLALTAGWPIPA